MAPDEIFENAQLGRSAVRVIAEEFDSQRLEFLAATVEFNPAEHFEPASVRMLDRVSQFCRSCCPARAARRRLRGSGRVQARTGWSIPRHWNGRVAHP